MEKEHSESMTTIPMKPEYAPSEVYSTEPPPAYHRPRSTAVQIAKITAVTVVLVSIILGGFILASAYVSATASCKQLEQELQLLTETADRLQPLQPEALVQDELQAKESNQVKRSEEPLNKVKEIDDNHVTEEPARPVENHHESPDSGESEDEEEKVTPIHIKLPLHLDLDDIAGSIIDKNQRSKMNCVIEKKRAEEVVDHKPKSIQLPFGLNITTDPRFEHVTGERMVIICESGSLQRNTPPQQPEEQEETIMIQPVVIPYGPPTHFQTHMPQQMRPMHPMETMRPPMPGPMMNQMQPQRPEIQVERVQSLPNPFIQQIAQQLINQRIRMEMQRAHEEAQRAAASSEQRDDSSQNSNELRQQHSVEMRQMPEIVMAHKLPIPDEVLRQINRMPNHEVIVSVSEESEETPQEVRFVQQPRESSEEMNNRQSYARGLPVHIPVPMMQSQENHETHQMSSASSSAASSEEMRPHYVQPRSVRSVDALLPKSEKRVKRCACDCAC